MLTINMTDYIQKEHGTSGITFKCIFNSRKRKETTRKY